MNKTKIDWCDFTWNPVWGCLNHCPYCYARKMALRHGDKEFKPRWMEANFNKSFPKKPSTIFVNSMSDIAFWKKDWTCKALNKIERYPQHNFLFLTKQPTVYDYYNFPSNCFLGITITNQHDMNVLADLIFNTRFDDRNKVFLSIEPIQCAIEILVWPDWLIIGQETGNRKEKITAKKEWINSLINQCRTEKIPVFLKSNLRSVYGEQLIQEFPSEFPRH